jgi:hypothetical protein
MEWAIKFRPLPPRSPHLNGKVERTQRSDLDEFWAVVDPKATDSKTGWRNGSISGTGIGPTWRWAERRR